MAIRSKILTLLATLIYAVPGSTTMQKSDYIVIHGRTHVTYGGPLSEVILALGKRRMLKMFPHLFECTNNHRGHIAFWRLTRGRLYLDKVLEETCEQVPDNELPVFPLQRLFPGAHAPIAAAWYTGELVVLSRDIAAPVGVSEVPLYWMWFKEGRHC